VIAYGAPGVPSMMLNRIFRRRRAGAARRARRHARARALRRARHVQLLRARRE
jgi:hypothetical protein